MTADKKASILVKTGTVIAGLTVFCVLSALALIFLVSEAQDIQAVRVEWLVFTFSAAVPVIPALIYLWKTACNIGRGKAICTENADMLQKVSVCTAVNSIWIALWNVVMFFLPKHSFSLILIASAFAVLLGTVVTVFTKSISVIMKNAVKDGKNGKI